MVSDEALKKLQEQIAAWPMTQRFVVQQLIEDYRRNREDLRAYKATGLTPEEIERSKLEIEAGCVKAIARTYGIDINRLRKLAEADKDGRLVVLEKGETPVIRDDGAIFHSVKEAAKSVGVHDTKVSAVCKGNRKTTGGHSFRFLAREEAGKALKTKEG